MNRLQGHLLQLLREIRDICAANGITYYLIGGSLIGAVRNRGFLPWDDDADVAMTYEGYERFKEACKTQLPPNRYLGDPVEDETYSHLLPRYMSTDTTAIHTSQSLHECVRGVVVDIFVLDPVADEDESYKAYLQDMFLLSSIVNYANAAGYRAELDPALYDEFMAIARKDGQLVAARLAEKRMISHFGDTCDKYAYRWQVVPYLLERSWFGKGQPVEFEGETFTAPQDINGNLTAYFGEEWPLVPDRVTPAKHNCALSLEFPCEEALSCFEPSYEASGLLDGMRRRQRDIIRNAKVSNALSDEWARVQADVAAIGLRKRIERDRDAFERALSARDGHALDEILGDFLSWQTSSQAIGRHHDKGYYRYTRPVLADIPDDLFLACLLALVDTGRIGHASRLLAVRRGSGLPLTGGIERVERDLAVLRESMSDVEKGHFADALVKARVLVDAHPDASWFAEVACAAAQGVWAGSGDASDLDAYERLADLFIGRFPANGLFRKAKADCLAARGRGEEAERLYLSAAEMTRNGIALLEIADKTGYHPRWLRKARWARAAGVAQWDGAEPQPIAVANAPAATRPCDDLQLGALCLLAELSEICADGDIPHVLAPGMMSAMEDGLLPGNIDDYAIVCHPRDAQRLIAALETAVGGNPARTFEYMGNCPSMSELELRYCSTDSLFLSVKDGCADRSNGLYCRVAFPVEPNGLSGTLGKMLEMRRGMACAARVSERWLPIRIADAVTKTCGEVLFRRAADEAASAETLRISAGKGYRDFKCAFFDEPGKVEFAGFEFPAPHDAEGYLALVAGRRRGSRSLQAGAFEAASIDVGYLDLVDSGVVDETLLARYARNGAGKIEGREAKRRFSKNFREIKDAVRAKELSKGAPLVQR